MTVIHGGLGKKQTGGERNHGWPWEELVPTGEGEAGRKGSPGRS